MGFSNQDEPVYQSNHQKPTNLKESIIHNRHPQQYLELGSLQGEGPILEQNRLEQWLKQTNLILDL